MIYSVYTATGATAEDAYTKTCEPLSQSERRPNQIHINHRFPNRSAAFAHAMAFSARKGTAVTAEFRSGIAMKPLLSAAPIPAKYKIDNAENAALEALRVGLSADLLDLYMKTNDGRALLYEHERTLSTAKQSVIMLDRLGVLAVHGKTLHDVIMPNPPSPEVILLAAERFRAREYAKETLQDTLAFLQSRKVPHEIRLKYYARISRCLGRLACAVGHNATSRLASLLSTHRLVLAAPRQKNGPPQPLDIDTEPNFYLSSGPPSEPQPAGWVCATWKEFCPE